MTRCRRALRHFDRRDCHLSSRPLASRLRGSHSRLECGRFRRTGRDGVPGWHCAIQFAFDRGRRTRADPPPVRYGSTDSALATVAKSAPAFSSLRACSALSWVSVTMMRNGTLAVCDGTDTENIDNNPRAGQHRSDFHHILRRPAFLSALAMPEAKRRAASSWFFTPILCRGGHSTDRSWGEGRNAPRPGQVMGQLERRAVNSAESHPSATA